MTKKNENVESRTCDTYAHRTSYKNGFQNTRFLEILIKPDDLGNFPMSSYLKNNTYDCNKNHVAQNIISDQNSLDSNNTRKKGRKRNKNVMFDTIIMCF